MNTNQQPRYRSGIASIIITVTLSLAVIAIITVFTLISANELEQSESADLSSTALSTARSGVEQLAQKVNENASYEQRDCNSASGTPAPENSIADPKATGQQVAITCGTVTDQGTEAIFRLQRDQSTTFDLSDAKFVGANGLPTAQYSGVSNMAMFWNIPNNDSPVYTSTDAIANPNFIDFGPLTKAGISRPEPAAVELTFSWCPKAVSDSSPASTQCKYTYGAGNFLQAATDFGSGDSGGDHTYTTLISPWTTRNTDITPNPATANTNKDSTLNPVTGEISGGISSDCRQDSQNYFGPESCHFPEFATNSPAQPIAGCKDIDPKHVCWSYISIVKFFPVSSGITSANQLEGYNLKLKVTPRYGSANFRMRFGGGLVAQGLGVPANTWFKFPYAQIDVTARAGEIYRHIQATKQIQFNNMLSYGLFSGANICKGLSYTDTGVKSSDNNVSCNEAP